jgi:autotransporter strand-loop-strand O-heptosyltransferase
MKIINVTPGLIPIPPNGWGAVEKIIWEFHNNLLILGHDSHITYLDDVPSDADIVHIHVANLALMARDRGIPYYFTCHDHHAYLYGKNSPVYRENLEAMRYAVKSFVPAKYLVEYFENIPEYFSHGVNTLFFSPPTERKKHKLLCVANNGYIHNQSEDRKGFGIAIEAARALNLPITIAGPSNNKNYFTTHPSTYDKLSIVYDVTEEELLQLYQTHTIFLHPSETEAGHPNLTLLEAMACGLPAVGTFEANNNLRGMRVVLRDVVDVTLGVQEVTRQYQQYHAEARLQAEALCWQSRTKELVSIYNKSKGIGADMRTQLINHYLNTKVNKQTATPRFNFNNVNGMFAEILGGPDTTYDISFINDDTNEVVFSTVLNRNTWAKTSKKHFINWKVTIVDRMTSETFIHKLNLTDKRVYIVLDSRSLGDTLAWIPYVDEFRKKHNCNVVASTFWNDNLKNQYPRIEFVNPGEVVRGVEAMYTLGLFYTKENMVNYDYHAGNTFQMPMQKIATDILGLEYKEIRPILNVPQVEKTNQVCIAIHSTTQAKYWNNPDGWQSVVDWLNNRGYVVRLLSNEGDNYMGNKIPTGVIQHPAGPIEDVMRELKKSKMFIGLGSGLSWLSWALEVPTVLISGFSYKWAEMQDCIRVGAPSGKCEGCFNRHRLDAGDWNWCPDHKNTSRQFECSRNITAQMVISELEKLL